MIDIRHEPTFDDTTGGAQRLAPPRRRSPARFVLPLAAVVGLFCGWLWLTQPEDSLVVRPPAPRAVEDGVAPPPQAQVQAPAREQPPLVAAPEGELLQPGEIGAALTALLGRDAVLRFLETTDFPRRAVATLDALGRDHAPVAAWPVLPAPDRFVVEPAGEATVVVRDNAARHAAFVAFVRGIDAAQAVGLYRRMSPVLQQAYRDLGFGGRSLNDRVLEVIALLLATPEPPEPLEVVLTEVKGPIKSIRPWTRYEFADPELQELAAGQKILLRVGPENRRLLKAKLQELRTHLLQASQPAAARP